MPSFEFDPPPAGAYIAAAPDDSRVMVWYTGGEWGGDPYLVNAGKTFKELYDLTPRYHIGNPARLFFLEFCDRFGLRLVHAPQSTLPPGAVS